MSKVEESQRIPVNKAVLVFGLLLAVWLALQFYPRKKPAPSLPPVAAESKLHIAGLADNPDWDGLPEFFALVAGKADWKDGRTRFAYWHPVMKTYSYYFEATRDGGSVRFREISEPHDPDRAWDESAGDDLPIRLYLLLAPKQPGHLPPSVISDPAGRNESTKVKLEVAPPVVSLPETKIAPPNPAAKP